jgi:hypothetical protein
LKANSIRDPIKDLHLTSISLWKIMSMLTKAEITARFLHKIPGCSVRRVILGTAKHASRLFVTGLTEGDQRWAIYLDDPLRLDFAVKNSRKSQRNNKIQPLVSIAAIKRPAYASVRSRPC